MRAACRLEYYFIQNSKVFSRQFSLPNRKCAMRRDCLWVYFTVIVSLFLDAIKNKKIVFDENPSFLENELESVLSLLPNHMVDSVNATKENENIFKIMLDSEALWGERGDTSSTDTKTVLH